MDRVDQLIKSSAKGKIDPSTWKCGLDDLESLFQPMPCSGAYEGCKSDEITEDDLKAIFVKRKKAVPEVKTKIVHHPDNPTTSTTFVEKPRALGFTPAPKELRNIPTIPPVVEVVQPPTLGFIPASNELRNQNMKKYGTPQPNNAPFQYGPKKTFGLSRQPNVRNAFVPPIRDEVERISEELVTDERLKHIDLKMIELIESEIMDKNADVNWDDIAGLEYAKSIISEAVVWPMLRPEAFTGLRSPPKGVLLFGPPGNGKTLIGKCIASQANATFFSISASTLTSKWIGEGEKMVRALFTIAKVHQPSVVFIDEIDSLLCKRNESEHESSRRIKTEFLVQLDGAGTKSDERVLVIGATNRPQELDEAARRRLVKRLYIPLPEFAARLQILKNLLRTERNDLDESQINEICEKTDGFSGADMKDLCQEAAVGPIRGIQNINAFLNRSMPLTDVRPVSFNDFQLALTRVTASVSKGDLDQYLVWNKMFGSDRIM